MAVTDSPCRVNCTPNKLSIPQTRHEAWLSGEGTRLGCVLVNISDADELLIFKPTPYFSVAKDGRQDGCAVLSKLYLPV